MVVEYSKFLKDRRPDERVVAVVRHHWWVLFRAVIGVLILFIVPFFLIPFAVAIITQGGAGVHVPGGFGLFFAALWALIMWHLIFAKWTDFYFDMWIITNLRIVSIDQKGFFNRQIATILDLDHIQDIDTKMVGLIGNILNFGTLELQTAGAVPEFEIDEVPNPQGVERVIRNTQLEHAHGTIHGKKLHELDIS